jgi:hypothetical protein
MCFASCVEQAHTVALSVAVYNVVGWGFCLDWDYVFAGHGPRRDCD